MLLGLMSANVVQLMVMVLFLQRLGHKCLQSFKNKNNDLMMLLKMRLIKSLLCGLMSFYVKQLKSCLDV